MRTTHTKGGNAHGSHLMHPAKPMNAHGGVAAAPRRAGFRRRLAALHAGMRAALRALRATNPKR